MPQRSISVLSDLTSLSLFRTLSARVGLPALVTGALVSVAAGWQKPVGARALFAAADVDADRFVLVSAPIGSGQRSQLNIYEQIRDQKPCFAVGEGRPAAVNPLLSTFNFSGICGRYIDANGYSVRIGGRDLGTVYRLMVSRSGTDNLLLAVPTRSGAGPEMVVARTHGPGSGFLKFHLEPGWSLKRRQFRDRLLGHIYIYNDNWPGATASADDTAPGGGAAPVPVSGD